MTDANAETRNAFINTRRDTQPGDWVKITGAVIHLCPDDNSGVTGCCGRTPFELPQTDRLTLELDAVTCAGPIPQEDA